MSKYSVVIMGANNAIKDHMWRQELKNKPHDIWEREHEHERELQNEQMSRDSDELDSDDSCL